MAQARGLSGRAEMRRVLLLFVVAAAALLLARDMRADDAGSSRRLRVVARAGSRTLTVGQIEDRLADLAPLQRLSLGADAKTIRYRFLTEIMLRDELLALGAEDEKLGARPPAAYQIERARSSATIRSIRGAIGPASAIAMEDVQRYYDSNRARYDTPERYHLWRILCKSREEAQVVLDATKRDPTPTNFEALAREHSLDKATNLRAGNLGFVTAEGSSNEPGLRVDPALVRAVLGLRDGSLAPEPVPEGDYFSVVWRRGTLAATKRSVGDVAPQIRDLLWRSRVKDKTDELVADLRARRLRDLDASLLTKIDIPVDVPTLSARSGSPERPPP